MEYENEPANALVDLAAEMFDNDSVRRIGFVKCVSRDVEDQYEKKDPAFAMDKDGYFKGTGYQVDLPDAEWDSKFAMEHVLIRRGAALDLGNVLSFEVHSCLSGDIMAALQRPVAPGYTNVTAEQVLIYDIEVWRRLANLCRNGIKVPEGHPKPLDALLPKVLVEPRVAMLLLPREAKAGVAASSQSADASASPTVM